MRFRPPIHALLASAMVALGLTGCGGGGSTPPPTPPAISVALSGQPTSLAVSATASITATVTNDSANGGVKWTATCGSSACGSFSSTTTASGAATVYMAPATIPTPVTVTVTATSVTDSTKLASAAITITSAVGPGISVALSPLPPASLGVARTASLTAVVTNDSANGGVKWTVACGSSACGSFSLTTTASGAATIYTAPSAIPTGGAVTVTATSVTDSTKLASATITITTISVALSPLPPAFLVVGTTSGMTAVVTNDSANGGVKWTVTCGSSACGSFSPTTTASGAATVYTAPTTIPSPATVTVTATSVTDTTKFASATITITPRVLAEGTYIFNLSGRDNTGFYFVTGAFTVTNGMIAKGEQDFRNYSSMSFDALVASGCSLSLAGGNIQIVLATANTKIGVNGVETLRGARVSNARTLLSEFDTYTAASGSLDLQTGTAAPSGGYAFLLSGEDGSSSPSTLGIGGVLNINGTSLSTSNSVFDYNDGTRYKLGQTFDSGTVSPPDSYGRVTFNLIPSTASTLYPFLLTGYIVGTNRIQLIESQRVALPANDLGAILGGTALGQGSNTNNFNAAMLANTSYVYGVNGLGPNGPSMAAGVFSFNAASALSGKMALNDLKAPANTTITGTYTVDATGRATLSNVVPAALPTDSFTFLFYLDGKGNALQLGADSQEVMTGPAYLQTATATDFEGSYALTGAGLLNTTNHSSWSAVGPVSVNADALTGATDYTVQTLTPYPAVALTGSENSTAGTLSLAGLNGTSFTTAYSYAYFPIDSSRVLAVEIDGQSLGLLTMEGVSQ